MFDNLRARISKENRMKTKKTKILVLDDEKQIVDVFAYLMKQFHYDADYFQDAETALDTVVKDISHYDLIVCDIRMPKMDGISFARKIRALSNKLPIVFMTGYPSDEIKREVQTLGNVIYLQKPFPLRQTFEDLIPKLLKDSAS